MHYNNEWLIEKFRRNEPLKYIFFWGHTPASNGSVTQRCFSQWWVAPFTVDGRVYPTAEHWMMAEKARLFRDNAIRDKISLAVSPAAAKKLGREVLGFDPVQWDAHKSAIVIAGNLQKFSQHPALRTFLLNTGGRILVEASPMDRIWGIGMAKSDEHIDNPLKWRGQNLLGYALMAVRDLLQTTINNQQS